MLFCWACGVYFLISHMQPIVILSEVYCVITYSQKYFIFWGFLVKYLLMNIILFINVDAVLYNRISEYQK